MSDIPVAESTSTTPKFELIYETSKGPKTRRSNHANGRAVLGRHAVAHAKDKRGIITRADGRRWLVRPSGNTQKQFDLDPLD